MLSNLKTFLDSIKVELFSSRRKTYEVPDTEKKGAFRLEDSDFQDTGPQRLSDLDHLDVLEEIGRGAFGTVYRAWDPVLQRHVALKRFFFDDGQIAEARKLARISSPNVVKIFRYENRQGCPELAMELVEGNTLADEVASTGALPCSEVAKIGADLCKAVSAVHNAGLLHRDIKAQNVMREPNGRVVLMDLGLGQKINSSTGHLAGTLPYIAPELFTGAPATVRSDLYSLGVLLYFLASGKYPVVADHVAGFREAHASGRRVALRKAHPRIQGSFARIIERAIAPSPELRYLSVNELGESLLKWQKKKPGPKILAMAVALGLAALLFFYAVREPGIPDFRLTQLTTQDGVALEPSISADGQTVAYASDASGRGDLDIWLRKIDEPNARRITDGVAHESEPNISPDGNQVVYRSEHAGGGIYILDIKGYIRERKGGPEREGDTERLLAEFGHNPQFSPDGRQVVFWDGSPALFSNYASKIYIVDTTGGKPRQLLPAFKDARYPTWSPDGSEILFQGCDSACKDVERESDWWRVRRDGSKPKPTGALQDVLKQGLSLHLGPMVWNGNDIIFGARFEHGTNLWRIPVSLPWLSFRRKATPLMVSTEEGVEPSISRNGAIAFSGSNPRVNLRYAAIQDREDIFREPLDSNLEIDSMPSVSADGTKILYFRRMGNSRRMIFRYLDRGVKITLGREILAVDVPAATRGLVSSSGRLIAYTVPDSSGRNIYVRRFPDWSPSLISKRGEVLDVVDDNHVLVLTASAISSLDLQTGQETILLQQNGTTIDQASVSPDQKWIAFLSLSRAERSQVFVAPLHSSLIGQEEWVPITKEDRWFDKPRWSKDGRSLVFFSNRDDFLCIWRQALDLQMHAAGEPQPVLHMHKARISPIHLSRIAANLSLSEDNVFFNATEISARVWVAH